MPRLFGVFEQGELSIARRFGGLGLGLSIVKSLMDMHHGTVKAESPGKNKGAKFTIAMPTTSTQAQRQSNLQRRDGEPKIKSCRVLLVEDHADTRYVMSQLISRLGCSVTCAMSVKEASEIAEHARFDLLICDYGLPDGTGADVMRCVNERQPIKGIAMTGFGQDEDIRRSREAGFAMHLTKPVNVETLQQAINEVGE